MRNMMLMAAVAALLVSACATGGPDENPSVEALREQINAEIARSMDLGEIAAFLSSEDAVAAESARWRATLDRTLAAAKERTANVPQYADAFADRWKSLAFADRWKSLSAASAKLDAIGFLVANMPHVDLGALTPDLMDENVDYALKARGEVAWKAQLTDELFYHYILPHRMSQEPTSAWRKRIHDELWPRVAALSMAEAALEVNRWCHEYATFSANSSSRDQGPLTTMWRGLGRCEELVILYVCAARAVGLPARQCYTPYWAHTDNNHAWAEVYADGKWWFVGGAEPADGLGQAWFDGPASRAGLVISVAFGEMEQCSEPIYAKAKGVTFINSTPVYGNTCDVSVKLPEGAPETDVFVHVVNYGSPRMIGKFRSGGSLRLGGGDYLLTAEVGGKRIAGFAHNTVAIDGGKWRVLEKQSVALDAATYTAVTTSGTAATNWLHYPIAERRDPAAKSSFKPNTAPELLAQLKTDSTTRKKAINQKRKAVQWFPPTKREAHWEDAKFDHMHGILNRTQGGRLRGGLNLDNYRLRAEELPPGEKWQPGTLGIGDDDKSIEPDVLSLFDDKALFEYGATGADNYDHPWLTIPGIVPSGGGLIQRQYPILDELHLRYLANERIDDEPYIHGATPVLMQAERQSFDPLSSDANRELELQKSEGERVGIASKCVGHIRRAESGRLGHIAAPIETMRARQGTEREIAILLVAELRAIGVPARVSDSKKWAEVLIDGTWEPVYPGEAFPADKAERVKRNTARAEKAKQTATADASFLAAPGTIELSFTEAGQPTGSVEAFANYAISRWQDGHFETDWLEYDNDKIPTLTTPLRPGDWFVFTSRRTRRGDACFRCYPVTVESQKTAKLTVETGIPPEQLDAADLIQHTLKAWPKTVLTKWAGNKPQVSTVGGLTLQQITNDKPTLLIMVETNTEPGRRLIENAAAAAKEAATAGVSLAVIYVGREGREQYAAAAEAAKLDAPVYEDTDGAFKKEIGAGESLAVILLDAGVKMGVETQPPPRTRLWTEGYNPSVAGLIRAALKQLPTSSK